ncbi:hypothetical protein BDN72DRAFT_428045 [Pluteus cervinus]|uniref:Uncharacterized protein n=1 Tax=Pluteus cervinus TaxID=181527 RepID=A0ACD3B0W7_9AGAR|nr:hypothetical protein BDN72DRAFT_428045 [Pluteus cervinus]
MSYPFLANPPPQKKRPTQPLPPTPTQPVVVQPRRRSNTYAAIANWASHVQPGSPGSPKRRPSVTSSRRPSLTRRRPSITHIRVTSNSGTSYINVIDTPITGTQPTPSAQEFDLTTLGYTSVFVHLPKTPATPAKFKSIKSAAAPVNPITIPVPHMPPSPQQTKPRIVKRFRSLSILRPRGRAKSSAALPTSPRTPKSAASKAKAEICAVNIARRNKAKYAYLRPAPLANELALMQFADGGKMESHVKRVMETQAKAAGGSSGPAGVADVYRDANGAVWWDQEEEWEYAHLLGGEQADGTMADEEMEWVQFGVEPDVKEGDRDPTAIASLAVDDRRGSVDSDLNPEFIMRPEDMNDDLAPFGGATTSRKPGMSVLAIPSRPRRAAKHLRKPEFIIDVAAFAPRSPRSPTKFVTSTLTSPLVATFSHRKQRGKARRRPAPAPLKLSPPEPSHRRPTNSPADLRRDFLDASFAPVVLPTLPMMEMKPPRKQQSKLNMKALFKRKDTN